MLEMGAQLPLQQTHQVKISWNFEIKPQLQLWITILQVMYKIKLLNNIKKDRCSEVLIKIFTK